MTLSLVSSNPERNGLTPQSARPRTLVRPHPTEAGVFILHSGEVQSTVYQGLIKIGGAVVEYTYEEPLNLLDPVPLLIVPGYGGIKPAYKDLRKGVVANGKGAATLKPARSQERFAALHPDHFFHPERLLAQSALGVSKDLIEKHGQRIGFEKVDTAGHSMGGPAVVNAGITRPERFRFVTAMAAAGLDGHSLIDMGRRAPGVFTGEILPSFEDIRIRKDYRTILHGVEYVLRNPWRTAAEGLAVGSGDIRDKVTMLGGLGVGTAALQFQNDHFFPEDGVREHSAERFDLYRVFPNPDANHMWPQLEPEAVADALVGIVNTLQLQASAG